jgi:ribosome-associated heat shock protein Hsp15
VNAARVTKPAGAVGPGDVLTFAQGRRIRVIRIVALATRRGPATEARALYDDMTPPAESDGRAMPGNGPRPTKRDRRALDALRNGAGRPD